MLGRRVAQHSPKLPPAGFTYIELMVAVAIMGVLALSAVPLSDWLRQRSQESQLRDALRQIRTAIDASTWLYTSAGRLAIDAYRKAAEDGTIARPQGAPLYPRNLTDLTSGIPSASGSGGNKFYFLRRIPRDPFFPDARVPAELTWGLRSSDSPPDRPTPGKDVFDVYSLSPRQALDGSYYRTW